MLSCFKIQIKSYKQNYYHVILTSDLDEASSSELETSDSGGFLDSLTSWVSDLLLAQRPFSLEAFLSAFPEEVVEEDAVRGEVPVNPPLLETFDPSEPPFFGFLTLGLGDFRIGRSFAGCFSIGRSTSPSTARWSHPPSLRRHAFHFGLLQCEFGLLESSFGHDFVLVFHFDLCFLGWRRWRWGRVTATFADSVPLNVPFGCDFALRVFRGRSRCSLAILWDLDTLLPSLLGSYRKKYCVNNLKYNLYSPE